MSTPLRDLLHELLFDGPARAAFAASPEQYLQDQGWDGLRGQDVEAALDALTDELPPDQAARIAPLAAGDGAFDGGVGDVDDGLGGAIAGLEAAVAAIDGDLPGGAAEPAERGEPPADDAASIDDLDIDDLDIDDLDTAGDSDIDDLDTAGDSDLDGPDHQDTGDLHRGDDADDLDELAFGAEHDLLQLEAELSAGDVADVAGTGGDPAAGIDFDAEPLDAASEAPWMTPDGDDAEPGGSGETGDASDDVID